MLRPEPLQLFSLVRLKVLLCSLQLWVKGPSPPPSDKQNGERNLGKRLLITKTITLTCTCTSASLMQPSMKHLRCSKRSPIFY